MKENDKDFFEQLDTSLSQFYSGSPDTSSLNQEELYPAERYTEFEFIAEGAVKAVYKVMDCYAERYVAMAKLKQTISTEDAVEDFLREAQLTASLEHPNIIRLYDVGCDKDGSPWFTMELIPGQSLQAVIDSIDEGDESAIKNWPISRRLEIISDICDAVGYAHSKGVFHLDIKPDNIRLGEFGEVLLCDWGISHSHSSSELGVANDLKNGQTLHGFLKGTPGFMAPEQTRAGYVKDARSDVFGLGALLFCLLTNKPPYAGETLEQVVSNTEAGLLRNDLDAGHLPPALLAVALKAMSTSTSDRYQSVVELQSDLMKFREGFATVAEQASTMTQAKLFYHRNRTVCLTALMFSVVLAVALCVFIQSLKRSEHEAKQSELVAQRALKQFQVEQLEKQLVSRNYSEILILQNRVNLDDFNFDRALRLANEAVERDPKNMGALMQKGFTHFIRREFGLAKQCFEVADDSVVDDLYQLSCEYAESSSPLDSEAIISLMEKITMNRNPLRMYMLKYDARTNPSRQEHSKIVEYLVASSNGNKLQNFEYDSNNKSLDLSSNLGLKTLTSYPMRSAQDFNLLQSLKIWHLDLSNSSFSDLKQLSPLKLRSLDLRNSACLDLEPLRVIETLKKVILTPEQKNLLQGQDWPFEVVFEEL